MSEANEVDGVVMCCIPMRNGKPEITNKMKAECIGEFSIDIEMTCSACAYAYDVSGDYVECEVCNGDINYIETRTIPWDTMKDIYKRMALVAIRKDT